MKSENTSTNKLLCPVVNPSRVMDEKTYQKYKIEEHKIFARWIKIILAALVIWPIYALINEHDVISFMVIIATIILGGWLYIINKTILRIKYKLPISGSCGNSSFSTSTIVRDNSNSPCNIDWYIRHGTWK